MLNGRYAKYDLEEEQMEKDSPKFSTWVPEEFKTTPNGQQPADSSNKAKDIIPDEVPRKDGPGGENK